MLHRKLHLPLAGLWFLAVVLAALIVAGCASPTSAASPAAAVVGTVTHFAGSTDGAHELDGTGTGARFSHPYGVAFDGTYLYVTDNGGSAIRRVNVSNFAVTTIAGGTRGTSDGTGSGASLSNPAGEVLSPDNSVLYFVDQTSGTVRKVVLSPGGGDDHCRLSLCICRG